MMNLPVPAMAPLLVGLTVVVALGVDLMLRLRRMRQRHRLPRASRSRFATLMSPVSATRPRIERRHPALDGYEPPQAPSPTVAWLPSAISGPAWPAARAWQITQVLPPSRIEQEQAQAAASGQAHFAVTAAPVGGGTRKDRANDSNFHSRIDPMDDSQLSSRYDSHLDSTLDSTWERQRAASVGLPVALATPRSGRSSLRQHVQATSRSHQEKRLRQRRSR